jgi:spermidine synthase
MRPWRCGRCGCSAASCAAGRLHALACAAVVAVLLATMAGADRMTTWAEDRFYGDNIVLRESSDYQRIVVTSGRPACGCS